MIPLALLLLAAFSAGAAFTNLLSHKPRYYRGPNGLKTSAKGPLTDYELTTLQGRGWTQISESEYRE